MISGLRVLARSNYDVLLSRAPVEFNYGEENLDLPLRTIVILKTRNLNKVKGVKFSVTST